MFDDACALLDGALTGDFRRQLLDDIPPERRCDDALGRLRHSLRAHTLKAGAQHVVLEPFVRAFDKQTRKEGFHVLHDWDGKADRVNPDTIPVDVLTFLAAHCGTGAVDRRAVAILVDYYLLHVLSLLTLRVWDSGDADANLERVDGLLHALQSADGSGYRFVDNAATLMLIATSHYELHEEGFHTLLARVRTLHERHQVAIALVHAASLGCHLRFGFEATCGRDTVATRDDNVADYPWLGFSLATLIRQYARADEASDDALERARLVEAILNGLTPDTRAFVGQAPASLSRYEADRAAFGEAFDAHKAALLDAFAGHRPSAQAYSPLSFFFNFSHNVLKGMVVHALLQSATRIPQSALSLNDLFTALPHDDPARPRKEAMAKTLMGYARANPDTIRGRPMPVIVYDPHTGREAFSVTMRKLKE
jgi:hypothetical protein